MFRRLVPTAFVIALFCLGVQPSFAASRATDRFVERASSGNQFEIASSQLAMQKSADQNVKTFAQQMIDDHTRMGDELKNLIASSNGDLKEPTAMDPKHQRLMDRLGKESGAAFDKDYIDAQVDAHNEMISLFTDYANTGDNENLRTFASNNVQALRQHHEHAQQVKDQSRRQR